MAKLPPLSGRQVVKALSKAGFEVVGRKGSHVRLKKGDANKNIHSNSAHASRNKEGDPQINNKAIRIIARGAPQNIKTMMFRATLPLS
jgi:predicted RNA binding protein YcfA (HicA-like mRNA interferase family)